MTLKINTQHTHSDFLGGDRPPDPSDHLTEHRRKSKLVLVVILATMSMGSRGALWKRERILWQDYCDSMLLWKPLKVSLRQAPKINLVETCMCLHNVMIDRCVSQEISPPVYSKSGRVTYRTHIDNNGAPTQLMTDDRAESTTDCGGMTDLRSKLMSQMKELEMKRPQLATDLLVHLLLQIRTTTKQSKFATAT